MASFIAANGGTGMVKRPSFDLGIVVFLGPLTHTIHGTGIFIYLHLADLYGKCRYIHHTWMLWVILEQASVIE